MRDPGVHRLRVHVTHAPVALQSRQRFARCEGSRSKVRGQVRVGILECGIECAFDEGQVLRPFQAIGPA